MVKSPKSIHLNVGWLANPSEWWVISENKFPRAMHNVAKINDRDNHPIIVIKIIEINISNPGILYGK